MHTHTHARTPACLPTHTYPKCCLNYTCNVIQIISYVNGEYRDERTHRQQLSARLRCSLSAVPSPPGRSQPRSWKRPGRQERAASSSADKKRGPDLRTEWQTGDSMMTGEWQTNDSMRLVSDKLMTAWWRVSNRLVITCQLVSDRLVTVQSRKWHTGNSVCTWEWQNGEHQRVTRGESDNREKYDIDLSG